MLFDHLSDSNALNDIRANAYQIPWHFIRHIAAAVSLEWSACRILD